MDENINDKLLRSGSVSECTESFLISLSRTSLFEFDILMHFPIVWQWLNFRFIMCVFTGTKKPLCLIFSYARIIDFKIWLTPSVRLHLLFYLPDTLTTQTFWEVKKHRIYSSNGFVKLLELRYQQNVCIWNSIGVPKWIYWWQIVNGMNGYH